MLDHATAPDPIWIFEWNPVHNRARAFRKYDLGSDEAIIDVVGELTDTHQRSFVARRFPRSYGLQFGDIVDHFEEPISYREFMRDFQYGNDWAAYRRMYQDRDAWLLEDPLYGPQDTGSRVI